MDIYANIQIRFISGSAYLLYRTLRSLNMKPATSGRLIIPCIKILDCKLWYPHAYQNGEQIHVGYQEQLASTKKFAAKWDINLRDFYFTLRDICNNPIEKKIPIDQVGKQLIGLIGKNCAYKSDIDPIVRCIIDNLREFAQQGIWNFLTPLFTNNGVGFLRKIGESSFFTNFIVVDDMDTQISGYYGTRYVHNPKMLCYACRKNPEVYNHICMLRGFLPLNDSSIKLDSYSEDSASEDSLSWDDVLMTDNKLVICEYIKKCDRLPQYIACINLTIFKLLERIFPNLPIDYLDESRSILYLANHDIFKPGGVISILRYICKKYPELHDSRELDIAKLLIRCVAKTSIMFIDYPLNDDVQSYKNYHICIRQIEKLKKKYPKIED